LRAAGLGGLGELKALLRQEEAVRHSDATQAAYAEAEAAGSKTDWLQITAGLQERLLRDAGVPRDRMAAALWLLRSAAQLWPEDGELRSISCWVRHNRASAGTLAPGSTPPDVPLYPIAPDAASTSVHRACGGAPTLVVAGSFT